MKLIVGLGNPGRLYIDSRHNMGFAVVRQLAKAHKINLKKDKGILSMSGRGRICGRDAALAMPLTFMNLSGLAVAVLSEKYKAGPQDLLIVCDDLDLEFGRVKIRSSGTSAGHRGIKSVIESLNTQDFSRLRVGIGRPREKSQAAEYVLSAFKRREKAKLKGLIIKAAQCCESWIEKGVTETMNVFNRRSNDNE